MYFCFRTLPLSLCHSISFQVWLCKIPVHRHVMISTLTNDCWKRRFQVEEKNEISQKVLAFGYISINIPTSFPRLVSWFFSFTNVKIANNFTTMWTSSFFSLANGGMAWVENLTKESKRPVGVSWSVKASGKLTDALQLTLTLACLIAIVHGSSSPLELHDHGSPDRRYGCFLIPSVIQTKTALIFSPVRVTMLDEHRQVPWLASFIPDISYKNSA